MSVVKRVSGSAVRTVKVRRSNTLELPASLIVIPQETTTRVDGSNCPPVPWLAALAGFFTQETAAKGKSKYKHAKFFHASLNHSILRFEIKHMYFMAEVKKDQKCLCMAS